MTDRVATFIAAHLVPRRDVEPGRELDISEAEASWAREKVAGRFHSDTGFSSMHVAGCVRMLMRSDLHHEMVCTMGRDRIARLLLEVHSLRQQLAQAPAPPASALVEFAKLVIRRECFAGGENGGEYQDEAVKLGLLRETRYDPEKHGSSDVSDPGDPWFVFDGPLASGQP